MPKKFDVWKYFTLLTDDNGKTRGKATCNKCRDGKEFDTKGGTTNMWRHFLKDFTHNVPDQGDEKGVVQCNICQSKLKASAGKSSLAEHVVACIEQQDAPAPVQTRAPPGSGPSSMDIEPADLGAQLPPPPPSFPSCPAGSSSDVEPGLDEPSKHLARMIALRGYDPSIVDDDCFRSFLRSLKPEFTMPSRVKIEEECDRIFDEARKDLCSRLSSSRGRGNLAVGRTKTVDKKFFYTTCHFIDDEWMLRKLIIDAFMVVDVRYHFNSSVLGVRMFSDSKEGSDDYCHVDKILYHISDHDISNRPFMLAYERYDQKFCMQLKDSIEDQLSDTNTRTREIFCTTYVDMVLHAIARCFLYRRFVIEIEYMVAFKLTREERQQLISHFDLDYPWMYYDQHWYTTYCSLKVFRMLSSTATDTNSFGELLSKVCDRNHSGRLKYNDPTSELLCKVWEEIHHAIQRISASSYPTSHFCLEMLLNMRKFLQSKLTHWHYGSIHHIPPIDINVEDCLSKASRILDEAVKDSYLVWSIPLALDPRYKFGHICSIFEGALEPEVATEYISKVTERMMELCVDYRKDEVGTSTGAGHSDSGVALAAGGADGDDPMHQLNERYYQDDEWDMYLSDCAPLAKDFDILKWWKGNSQKYPTLARMARDALAMPTCSKASSDEIAQIRSIVHGHSQKPFEPC